MANRFINNFKPIPFDAETCLLKIASYKHIGGTKLQHINKQLVVFCGKYSEHVITIDVYGTITVNDTIIHRGRFPIPQFCIDLIKNLCGPTSIKYKNMDDNINTIVCIIRTFEQTNPLFSQKTPSNINKNMRKSKL